MKSLLVGRITSLLITLCFLPAAGNTAFAQSLAAAKAAQRYEIDAKRIGTNIYSADALPRSREFKRIDSTYYVGWMYEGVYKYEHAADYLGYKNASVPLERALKLMERDYRKELGTRTSDLMVYFPAYRFQLDYSQVALYLMNCYSNMEEADSAYKVLRRVLKWNFQRDYYLDAYNYMGWLVHRNRYYTSAKYPFLKNSIQANEKLANKYLDSGLRRIAINRRLNQAIFQPGYEEQEKLAVYHYKSILYSYSLQIDSAKRYYDLLRNSPIFPHNNYATFRAVCGDFREAEKEYEEAVAQDAADKRLKEWAYYTSIIDIYKAEPRSGIELLKDMIKANGSTPGFGWYNIALARCQFYNGKLKEAARYTNKAAEFKELHIGTTLSQAHYDFSIQLQKLMQKQAELERQKFENKNWWYNPAVLTKMGGIIAEKYTQQFLIINQFSQNPERDLVIYKLFSTESTVSWDEVWYLIKDFSTRFFINRFTGELQKDKRQYVRKYFRYFIARLKMETGDYREARSLLNEIARDPNTDAEYEKLFIARVYQAQAECAEHDKDDKAYNTWVYRMYGTYPQLIPDAGLKMSMRLHISGQANEEVISRLKDCNINWVNNAAAPAVDVFVRFTGDAKKPRIEYSVQDDGKTIVETQSFGYEKADKAGTELAYRLFNIGDQPRAKEETGI